MLDSEILASKSLVYDLFCASDITSISDRKIILNILWNEIKLN